MSRTITIDTHTRNENEELRMLAIERMLANGPPGGGNNYNDSHNYNHDNFNNNHSTIMIDTHAQGENEELRMLAIERMLANGPSAGGDNHSTIAIDTHTSNENEELPMVAMERMLGNGPSGSGNNNHHNSNDGRQEIPRIAEWRFPIFANLVSLGYTSRTSDFRNPQTGESILPTPVFDEMYRDAGFVVHTFRCMCTIVLGLIYASIYIALYIPFAPFLPKSPVMYVLAVFTILLIDWRILTEVKPWTINFAHTRMQKVVEKHQGRFMEYGVKLGFFHEPAPASSSPYLVLQRFPEQQQRSNHMENTNMSMINEAIQVEHEAPPQQHEHYPPIYTDMMVPGDIHVSEKYDPSMVLDQDIWSEIHYAHLGGMEELNRPRPCVGFFWFHFLVVWYSSILFFPVLIYFWKLEAFVACLSLWIVFFLVRFNGHRSRIQACHQVARKVTATLLQGNDYPNLVGTQLVFQTSRLPHRTRFMSRRYQLVPVLPPQPVIHHHDQEGGQ